MKESSLFEWLKREPFFLMSSFQRVAFQKVRSRFKEGKKKSNLTFQGKNYFKPYRSRLHFSSRGNLSEMALIATSAGIPGFQSRHHLGNARRNHRFTAPVSPRWNVSISSEGKVKKQTLSRAASSDVSPRPPSNRPPILPIIRNGSNIYYIERRRREIKARYCRADNGHYLNER